MANTGNLQSALTFLSNLQQNNDRGWFKANRPAYDSARSAVEDFLDEIIDALRGPDHLEALTGKQCLSRIYRDVRFSKDKSPYKINMGAMIAPGGWHNTRLGYYVSIQPGGESMVAGGLYQPDRDQLMRFRQIVDLRPARLLEILNMPAFVQAFGSLEGERLKTAPKGYDRDHPRIEMLQLKQIFAMRSFSDQEILTEGFADRVVGYCRVLRPFLDYLQEEMV